MNNPTETAQKILKGCGKRFIPSGKQCGLDGLCPTCKATLLAKKEEWQNEIDDWKWVANTCNDTRVKTYGAKKVEEYQKAGELANG